MHELIENMSPASKVNGERNLQIEDGSKFPSSGSPYSCQKKMVMEEGDAAKKHQMPPASVMTRLILIMVWRKLIRNPNTYSSVLGLIWSLVSYRYQTKPKRYIFMQRISNQSYSSSQIFINWFYGHRWHIKMPTIMSGSISILSDAGLGMAMFSLGTFFFFFTSLNL